MGGNALYAQGAGALLGAFSKAVRPTADIRMWDSLPASILVGTTRWGAAVPAAPAAKGKKTAAKPTSSKAAAALAVPQVSMTYRQDDSPLEIPGIKPMAASAGRCGIIWSRSRSASALSPEAPGNNAKVAAGRKQDKAVWAKDQAFRASLR